MRINQIIRSIPWYVVPSLVFGLISLFLTLRFGLADTQIWFNERYTKGLDAIMPWYTHLGDGLIFLGMIIPLLFFKRQALLSLFLAGFLTLVLSSALKAYFDEPRPLAYFEQVDYDLRQVEGVKPHYRHSFPSGHTTAAFAAWGILAFYVRKRPWQFVFFMIATGVAYSRIYLSMHFLRDVGAGAILGLFVCISAVFLASKVKKPWTEKFWFKQS